MKHVRVSAVSLLVLSLCNNIAYASEINPSSLSGGGQTVALASEIASEIDLSMLSDSTIDSHNHVYQQEYDATYHWDKCLICKQEINKVKHTITTRYSISSTTCNRANNKITSCSKCAYNDSVPSYKSHTFSYLQHWMDPYTKVQSLHSVCSKCGGNYYKYDNSSTTGIYKYSNGSRVNCENVKIGSTIYNPGGGCDSISWVYKDVAVDTENEMFDVTYEILDKSKLKVDIAIKMPDKAHEWFSTSKFTNSNYVYILVWYVDLHASYPGSRGNTKISASRYDAETNTLYATYTFPLKDYKKNYDKSGKVEVAMYLLNGTNRCRYSAPSVEIPINFDEPEISSIGL